MKIGKSKISQEKSAKLLGMTMESSGEWNKHISGVGGLIPMLNKRLYLIKRLRNHLNDKNIQKVAESIFMSKIMYGLQLLGKIRWAPSDPQTSQLKELQKTQNRLLRFLNKSKISDKVSTNSILKKLNMCSVNQFNAKTKLTEMWKSVNLPNHNLAINRCEMKEGMRSSRSISGGKLMEEGFSEKSTCTFINDATRAWNKAPTTIKNCKSLFSAKKAIKSYVMTLPT